MASKKSVLPPQEETVIPPGLNYKRPSEKRIIIDTLHKIRQKLLAE